MGFLPGWLDKIANANSGFLGGRLTPASILGGPAVGSLAQGGSPSDAWQAAWGRAPTGEKEDGFWGMFGDVGQVVGPAIATMGIGGAFSGGASTLGSGAGSSASGAGLGAFGGPATGVTGGTGAATISSGPAFGSMSGTAANPSAFSGLMGSGGASETTGGSQGIFDYISKANKLRSLMPTQQNSSQENNGTEQYSSPMPPTSPVISRPNYSFSYNALNPTEEVQRRVDLINRYLLAFQNGAGSSSFTPRGTQ